MKDNSLIIDSRLKRFVGIDSWKNGEVYSVYLNDVDETFWFDDCIKLQEFLNTQTRERFYDSELREGRFSYVNENNDTIVYIIDSVARGRLSIKEDFIQ